MKHHLAYLSLGSNIEPKLEHLSRAVNRLDEHDQIHLLKVSTVYDTAPVGYTEQDNFLNLALSLETTLPALDLLDVCQSIEADLKRVRLFKNGPRTIDVDILLYDEEILDHERLTLPHPRMHERAFVLYPLAEIAPDAMVPNMSQTVLSLRDQLPDSDQEEVKSLGD